MQRKVLSKLLTQTQGGSRAVPSTGPALFIRLFRSATGSDAAAQTLDCKANWTLQHKFKEDMQHLAEIKLPLEFYLAILCPNPIFVFSYSTHMQTTQQILAFGINSLGV